MDQYDIPDPSEQLDNIFALVASLSTAITAHRLKTVDAKLTPEVAGDIPLVKKEDLALLDKRQQVNNKLKTGFKGKGNRFTPYPSFHRYHGKGKGGKGKGRGRSPKPHFSFAPPASSATAQP